MASVFLVQMLGTGDQNEWEPRWLESQQEMGKALGFQVSGVMYEGRKVTELDYSVRPDCWRSQKC